MSAKGSLGVSNFELYREERILQTSVLQASGEDDRPEVPIDPIPVARQSRDIYWLVCISILSWTILSLTEMPLFSRLTVHWQEYRVLFTTYRWMGFFIRMISFLTQNRRSINTWWVDKQVNCLTSKSPVHRYRLKPWLISNKIETRSLGWNSGTEIQNWREEKRWQRWKEQRWQRN